MGTENSSFLMAPLQTELSRQIALTLATSGIRIILFSADEDLLNFLSFEIENLGGRAYTIYCNMEVEESVSKAVKEVEKFLDLPEILIFFGKRERITKTTSHRTFSQENFSFIEEFSRFPLKHVFLVEETQSKVSVFHHPTGNEIKSIVGDFGSIPKDSIPSGQRGESIVSSILKEVNSEKSNKIFRKLRQIGNFLKF